MLAPVRLQRETPQAKSQLKHPTARAQLDESRRVNLAMENMSWVIIEVLGGNTRRVNPMLV